MRCPAAGQTQWTVELSHRLQPSLAPLMPLISHVEYRCSTKSGHSQHIKPLNTLAHRQQTAKTSEQLHEHAVLTGRQDCYAMLPPPAHRGLPKTCPIAGEYRTITCIYRRIKRPTHTCTDTTLLQSPYFYKSAWARLAQKLIGYYHHAFESSMHATRSLFAILLHVLQTWQARGMLQASPSPDDSDQGSATEDSSADSSDSPAVPTPPAPGAGEERELPCWACKRHLIDSAKYMHVHVH